jgi:hypothetical protein
MMKKLIYLFLLVATMLPQAVQAQRPKSPKKKKTQKSSSLTPEQQDLKKTASYLTDGRSFTDDEIIELSRILKKVDFSKKQKDIKNKATGGYPLNYFEKQTLKRMHRKENRVRNELNKYWEKKSRPKGKEELKRYKAMKKKSDNWNKKKAR